MKRIAKILALTLCALLIVSGIAFAEWQKLGEDQVIEGVKISCYMDDNVQDCGSYCLVKDKAEFVGAPFISKCEALVAYKLNKVGDHKEVDTTLCQVLEIITCDANGVEIPERSTHREFSENAWKIVSDIDEFPEIDDTLAPKAIKKYYDQKYNSFPNGLEHLVPSSINLDTLMPYIPWLFLALGFVLIVLAIKRITGGKKYEKYQKHQINDYQENITSVAAPRVAPVARQDYTPPKPKQLTLFGYKGCFHGMTMPIHRFPCKIGRDTSQCKVQFPRTTEGVSRLHCTIYEKSGVFTVEDSSTYGTFVNGKKITPHSPVRLNNGDYLAIGSSNEIFSVKF